MVWARKPGRRKKPKATEEILELAQVKAIVGDHKQAEEITGIKQDRRNKSLKHYEKDYRKKMEKKFQERAEVLMEELYSLAMKGKAESVKLSAIKDWLDRSGLAPVSKSEIEERKVISAESKVSKDIINRLNKIENETKKDPVE